MPLGQADPHFPSPPPHFPARGPFGNRTGGAARTEGTRVLLVISDGLSAAADSNIGELERHLLGVCRALEAREGDGVHLCGIGIGEERVKTFYRNAEVIMEVEELPGALVGVVERVLVGNGDNKHEPMAMSQTSLSWKRKF